MILGVGYVQMLFIGRKCEPAGVFDCCRGGWTQKLKLAAPQHEQAWNIRGIPPSWLATEIENPIGLIYEIIGVDRFAIVFAGENSTPTIFLQAPILPSPILIAETILPCLSSVFPSALRPFTSSDTFPLRGSHFATSESVGGVEPGWRLPFRIV